MRNLLSLETGKVRSLSSTDHRLRGGDNLVIAQKSLKAYIC